MIRRFGPAAEVLEQVTDAPRPAAGPGEILVRVQATSVNPIDCAVRAGYGSEFFKARGLVRMPLIPGRDVAGTVEEIGAGVDGFTRGQKVYAAATNFATAEFIGIPASWAAPMPRALSFTEAAALPYIALTAWSALVDAAGLDAKAAAGKRVIVPRGAGGVGSFAVQLMKAWGASVASSCSARNVEFVRGLGADPVVDYGKQKLDDVLRDYDAVLDTTFDREAELLSALKTHADAVYVGVVTPKIRLVDEFGVADGLRRGEELLSQRRAEQARLGRRYYWSFMEPNGTALREIGRLVESGKVRPVIDSVFPVEDIVKAHERCETRQARGKIVLTLT